MCAVRLAAGVALHDSSSALRLMVILIPLFSFCCTASTRSLFFFIASSRARNSSAHRRAI